MNNTDHITYTFKDWLTIKSWWKTGLIDCALVTQIFVIGTFIRGLL